MIRILSELENLDIVDTENIIEDFFSYYSRNERHKYHEITMYLIKKFSKPEDGETMSVILENLKTVMENVEQKCNCGATLRMDICLKEQPPTFVCTKSREDSKCEQYKWLYKKLSKLYDHISLEVTRLSDIRGDNDYIHMSMTDLKERENKLGNAVDDIDQKTKKITKEIVMFEKKMNGMQKEYITILGIFASIVLAFTGGIAFSTSVLENMHQVSPYRLAFVIEALAFVLINTIYILVWFVQKLYDSEQKGYPIFMIIINAIIILTIAITVWCWHIGFMGSGLAADALKL